MKDPVLNKSRIVLASDPFQNSYYHKINLLERFEEREGLSGREVTGLLSSPKSFSKFSDDDRL
jgi:hypothetical protein